MNTLLNLRSGMTIRLKCRELNILTAANTKDLGVGRPRDKLNLLILTMFVNNLVK